MQKAPSRPSSSLILRTWFKDLAISMGIGGLILVPILIASSFVEEPAYKNTIDYSWSIEAQEHTLPADDLELTGWVTSWDGIEGVRSRRYVSDSRTYVEVKFEAHWPLTASSDGSSSASLEDFQERMKAELPNFGYEEPTGTGKKSQAPFKVHTTALGWVVRCFLLASVGFLVRARRSWVLRSQETAGVLGSPVSAGMCLLWGSPAGLGFSILGYATYIWTGDSVPYSGLYFWALFMHPVFTVIVVFLTVTIVPIGQEVFLRHHLYARMSAAGSGVKGALISSCLPALFLAALPSAALMLFAQGLASCWLYRKTGRLLVPILLSATITACFFALAMGLPGDMDSWLQETMSQLLK